MIKKMAFLSAALLLSWPASPSTLRSAYMSSVLSVAGNRYVSNQWRPLAFDLEGPFHKWEALEDGSFKCNRSGVYFFLLSSSYVAEQCPNDETVRIRCIVNNNLVWNACSASLCGDNKELSLRSHFLYPLKKGDVVRFEHMRTRYEGTVSQKNNFDVPASVLTIVRVD